ncbi:MAG: hypothetical protein HN929_13310 [Chloroflexi bacterium]|nr:hypothetical protein [Chloroflexota bacterium]MBT7082418.1 hypothetical protein [Chloroflexota bacterium]MBT7289178.1 hypothetical protein [Chloroflexota bacterium]
MSGIADLDTIMDSLGAEEKAIFLRLFHVHSTVGQIRPPYTMHDWIKNQFGSVEQTLEQKVIRVTNLVTLEESLFNKLRADRPISEAVNHGKIDVGDNDPFHDPLANTPEDVFGRIKGKYCVTASNVAKYDGLHGVIVFDEADPLKFTAGQVVDYIDTGTKWAKRAHEVDADAKYYFFMWNCLAKAGASLVHGHTQVALSRHMHYAKIERLRRAALAYESEHGSDYFDDLYKAHESVGCGIERDDVRILSHLTPVKEKEVVLMAPTLNDALKSAVYTALSCLRDNLGTSSFNLVIQMPPIAEVDEDWSCFPVMVRIVDRGNPDSKVSDMGAMELYGASVITSDPFEVARALKDCF